MAVWDEKLVAVMLPEKKEAILYYSELGKYINNVDTPEGEGRERECDDGGECSQTSQLKTAKPKQAPT